MSFGGKPNGQEDFFLGCLWSRASSAATPAPWEGAVLSWRSAWGRRKHRPCESPTLPLAGGHILAEHLAACSSSQLILPKGTWTVDTVCRYGKLRSVHCRNTAIPSYSSGCEFSGLLSFLKTSFIFLFWEQMGVDVESEYEINHFCLLLKIQMSAHYPWCHQRD